MGTTNVEIAETLRKIVSKTLGTYSQVMPTDTAGILGMDSLDIIEFVMAVEDELGIEIPDEEVTETMTADKFLDLVCELYREQRGEVEIIIDYGKMTLF